MIFLPKIITWIEAEGACDKAKLKHFIQNQQPVKTVRVKKIKKKLREMFHNEGGWTDITIESTVWLWPGPVHSKVHYWDIWWNLNGDPEANVLSVKQMYSHVLIVNFLVLVVVLGSWKTRHCCRKYKLESVWVNHGASGCQVTFRYFQGLP